MFFWLFIGFLGLVSCANGGSRGLGRFVCALMCGSAALVALTAFGAALEGGPRREGAGWLALAFGLFAVGCGYAAFVKNPAE